ncbi:MAG: endolytic transglycosylase MltG [Elusimicrobiales bacterium]
MKRGIRIAAALAAMALLAAHYFQPGGEVLFDIKDGASGAQVARDLRDHKIIRSATWFRVLLRVTRTKRKLRSGRYRLKTNMSSEEALWDLLHTDGRFYVRVSIPEGWRAEQIAEKLQAMRVTDAAEFMKIVRAERLEGMLFPSTYFFEEGIPASQPVAAMNSEFNRAIRPILAADKSGNLSAPHALAMASIVEREAVVAAERPLIAAVYLNRVRQNMLLEADPTVQYALGYIPKEKSWWKKRILLADLRVDSPYNTYMYAGIPPGPICNPGLESVRAVLNPAAVDALYFVADRRGNHIFNRTYAEHLKAKKMIEQAFRRKQ